MNSHIEIKLLICVLQNINNEEKNTKVSRRTSKLIEQPNIFKSQKNLSPTCLLSQETGIHSA